MGWISLSGSILDDLKACPDAQQEEVFKKKKNLNIKAVNIFPLQLIKSNKNIKPPTLVYKEVNGSG